MSSKELFFVEVTDTFGGEANYSWVTRYIIRAASPRGVINALSRRYGLSWHSVECDRYDSKSGATCCFVMPWCEYHLEYNYDTDDRTEKEKQS